MARLPIPNQDANQWGALLNEFLLVSHHDDGTLRRGVTDLNVRDFGAKGDGVTNDTTAFQQVAAQINALGGGKIVIPPGAYVVGRQTFAGSKGKGYAYLPEDILLIKDCPRTVIIEGYGAILKSAPGLHYGSFDPVTGERFDPPNYPNAHFTERDYRADVNNGMIQLLNNAAVKIFGVELDGNLDNYILGGGWGDVGRQCGATGIRAYGNANMIIENVYTHHHGADGLIIGGPTDVAVTAANLTTPHTLLNVIAEYNARQGFSWVGGIGLSATNCKFNHTGRARFSSPPGAGVDIEAEGSSVCRQGVFINCEFSNNAGVGMGADSGDSADVTFVRCKFVGTTAWSIWPRKPRFHFYNCFIVGSAVHGDGAAYTECTFSHDTALSPTGEVCMEAPYHDFSSESMRFTRCIFDAGANAALPWSTAAIYDSCFFKQVGQRPFYTRGAFYGTNIFEYPHPASDGSDLWGSDGSVFNGNIIRNGTPLPKLRGSLWPLTHLNLFANDGNQGATIKLASHFTTDASWFPNPTLGDIVLYSLPVAGDYLGWVYTHSGWKRFGAIEP